MGRIIGHMVTRNERNRYLEESLQWLAELVDVVHVYDDDSTDGTFELARSLGVNVDARPLSVPPFAEHEGCFREAAWWAMEAGCGPTWDDWILCLDADEFLYAYDAADFTADYLARVIERAHDQVAFRVGEVFGWDEFGVPQIRVDGFWGQITACRLVRWRPGARFHDRAEGGGSVPAGWNLAPTMSAHLGIMHLGYARPEDREAKYNRYRASTGHSPQHIASIRTSPDLTPWPAWARGPR